MWKQQLLSIFKGGWNEAEQAKFSLGFFAGFILTMAGFGLGFLIVHLMGG